MVIMFALFSVYVYASAIYRALLLLLLLFSFFPFYLSSVDEIKMFFSVLNARHAIKSQRNMLFP